MDLELVYSVLPISGKLWIYFSSANFKETQTRKIKPIWFRFSKKTFTSKQTTQKLKQVKLLSALEDLPMKKVKLLPLNLLRRSHSGFGWNPMELLVSLRYICRCLQVVILQSDVFWSGIIVVFGSFEIRSCFFDWPMGMLHSDKWRCARFDWSKIKRPRITGSFSKSQIESLQIGMI